MTPKEANKVLEMFLHKQCDLNRTEFAYNQSEVWRAVDAANKALKKQIPKKPRVDDESWLCCPNCNETFAMFDMLNRRLLCCGCCGQKLDWSEVDAKKRSDTE